MSNIIRINCHNRSCGFFSDFNLTLSGLLYIITNRQSNFYVDWRSHLYSSSNENLFDKYFYQQYSESEPVSDVINEWTPFGAMINYICMLKSEKEIYSGLLFPSTIIKERNILNSQFINSIDSSIFNDKKILGLHRRGTDHGYHGELMDDSVYMKIINEEFKKDKFDKVFLITDQKSSLDFFKNELGDSLIHTDSFLSEHGGAIHHHANPGPEIIASQVLRDAILLSKTDYMLLTRSNVSLFSLMCNLQKDNFKYIDNHITYH